jgi:hypothetical protein
MSCRQKAWQRRYEKALASTSVTTPERRELWTWYSHLFSSHCWSGYMRSSFEGVIPNSCTPTRRLPTHRLNVGNPAHRQCSDEYGHSETLVWVAFQHRIRHSGAMAMAAPASAKTRVCHVTHSVHDLVLVISVGDAAWNNGHAETGDRPATHQANDQDGECSGGGGVG